MHFPVFLNPIVCHFPWAVLSRPAGLVCKAWGNEKQANCMQCYKPQRLIYFAQEPRGQGSRLIMSLEWIFCFMRSQRRPISVLPSATTPVTPQVTMSTFTASSVTWPLGPGKHDLWLVMEAGDSDHGWREHGLSISRQTATCCLAPRYFRSPHQRGLPRQGPCLLDLGALIMSLPSGTKLLDHKLISSELIIALKIFRG